MVLGTTPCATMSAKKFEGESGLGVAKQFTELLMNAIVAGAYVGRAQFVTASRDIGYLSPGFADHENSRRDIPRIQAIFPESIISSRCDIGQVERGGTPPADAGRYGHDTFELLQK